MEEVICFIQDQLMPRALSFGAEVRTCTLPSLTRGGCINGADLMRLHPRGEPCSLAKDPSQRAECQCTRSLDIGRWFLCYHGCRYCYGNPMELEAPDSKNKALNHSEPG